MGESKLIQKYTMATLVERFSRDNLENNINNYIIANKDLYVGNLSIGVKGVSDDFIDVNFTWSTYPNAFSDEIIGVKLVTSEKYRSVREIDEIEREYGKNINIKFLGSILFNNYDCKFLILISRSKSLAQTENKETETCSINMEENRLVQKHTMITLVERFNRDNLENNINNFIIVNKDLYEGNLSIGVKGTSDDFIDMSFTWSTYPDAFSNEIIGVKLAKVSKYQTMNKINEIASKYSEDINIDLLTRFFINNYDSEILLLISKPKTLVQTEDKVPKTYRLKKWLDIKLRL